MEKNNLKSHKVFSSWKKYLLLLIMVGTGSFLSAGNISFAAAPLGTFTGTAQTVTVDPTSTTVNPITITAGDGSEINTTNEIQIYLTTSTNAIWDTSVTTPTMMVTGTGAVNATVTYSGSDKTLNIDVTTNFGNGDSIQITGLKIFPKATASAFALAWSVDGGGVVSGANANTAITINAAAMNATITALSAPTVGSTGTATVNFAIPNDLVLNDRVVFTLPGNLDPSAVAFSSHSFGGGGTFTCTAASQVVTCVAGGAVTRGTGNLIVSGIKSNYEATSQSITNAAVKIVSAAPTLANAAATATGAIATDTVAATMPTGTFDTNSKAAGSSVMATVQLTTVNDLNQNELIQVLLPAGYNAGSITGASCTGTGVTNSFVTVTGTALIATLRYTGVSAITGGTVITCTFSNLINPTTTGATGTFTIQTAITDSTQPKDKKTGVAAITISGSAGGTYGYSNGGEYIWQPTPGQEQPPVVVVAPIVSGTQETSGAVSTQQTTQAPPVTGGTQNQTIGVTPHESSPFTDVIGHWAAEYINQLYAMKVVQGRTPTMFMPDATLTRAEMVKIAMLTHGLEVPEGGKASFKDVSGNCWCAKYIAAGEKAGIVKGYSDNTFRPNAPVNRFEALKILLLAAGKGEEMKGSMPAPFVDVVQSEWYAMYVNYAYENGVVSGKDKTHFSGTDEVTRGEVSKMAIKALELQ